MINLNSNLTPPGAVVIAISNEDKPYLARLSPMLKGVPSRVFVGKIDTLAEFFLKLDKAGVKHIITTRQDILNKLIPLSNSRKKPSIDNYAGSIIPYANSEILIINPLRQLVTKSYGEFITRRYISKIVSPKNWRPTSKFDWKLIENQTDFEEAYEYLNNCDLIGVDIETVRKDAAIKCVGYCGLDLAANKSMAYVFPVNSMQAVMWMRKLNYTKVSKVLQNGKYDINYFLRYSAPIYAYYFDTANMLHAWYSELPKDLGSVASLFIRNSMYWKDLSETNDKIEYYKYNALDCWGTVESAVTWILQSPDWARSNYTTKFPQVAPAILCEMRGFKRDMEKLAVEAERAETKQESILDELRKSVGHAGFNPSSHVHVKKLMKALGEREPKSSDETHLKEFATKHPLNEYFAERILEYRGERKLSSTYLTTGDKAKEFKGRVLFSLNPHGTTTGRYASKEHHFWCGLQIQNIPKDSAVKATVVADEGFELWEADYSQAEDRGVAYKSGDSNLLQIFNSGVDSHSYKASMFFGIPYEEITPVIRQLGKRINHGANYNMGERVLLDTMGSKAVRETQRLLNLPARYTLLEVCAHLLFLYERAFPVVKGRYYASIKKEIRITNMLVGDTGWTRYCFGDPFKSKPALNEYVAHVTQSLNAMILDKAFMLVFRELGFNPDFKLGAQIHDSILFQTRIGCSHLAETVKELMTFPIPVTDCSGVTREMTVPVELTKLGKTWKGHE